jgi:DNA polymerase III alpha subunit
MAAEAFFCGQAKKLRKNLRNPDGLYDILIVLSLARPAAPIYENFTAGITI